MKKKRKTRFQQLHLIITIIGALVATGICIYVGADLYIIATWVSLTIVVFYALGQLIRMYLAHTLKQDDPKTEEIKEGDDFTVGEIIEDNDMEANDAQANNAYALFTDDNTD